MVRNLQQLFVIIFHVHIHFHYTFIVLSMHCEYSALIVSFEYFNSRSIVPLMVLIVNTNYVIEILQ